MMRYLVNKSGLVTLKVTKSFSESTVSKILEMVQNAGSKKSKTENFITKFARYYTPTVVVISIIMAIIPPIILKNTTFYEWFYRALIFLVLSCPCALVISIPLGFFGGSFINRRNQDVQGKCCCKKTYSC